MVPIAYSFWWGKMHNVEPLDEPISLNPGTYVSPYFTTDLDDDYQIEIDSVPYDRAVIVLDWRIETGGGETIRQGTYTDQLPGGNWILLGHYRPKVGLRQRIVLRIRHGVQETGVPSTLQVGLPERGLDSSYSSAIWIVWARIFTGLGVLMLLITLILHAVRQRGQEGAEQPTSINQ
jgi:hypothetical protein